MAKTKATAKKAGTPPARKRATQTPGKGVLPTATDKAAKASELTGTNPPPIENQADTALDAPRERKRVLDPLAGMGRNMTTTAPGDPIVLTSERIQVNVPKAFTLTTDDHEAHHFTAGRQKMHPEHANHPYAKANGVKIMGADDTKE